MTKKLARTFIRSCSDLLCIYRVNLKIIYIYIYITNIQKKGLRMIYLIHSLTELVANKQQKQEDE